MWLIYYRLGAVNRAVAGVNGVCVSADIDTLPLQYYQLDTDVLLVQANNVINLNQPEGVNDNQ